MKTGLMTKVRRDDPVNIGEYVWVAVPIEEMTFADLDYLHEFNAERILKILKALVYWLQDTDDHDKPSDDFAEETMKNPKGFG